MRTLIEKIKESLMSVMPVAALVLILNFTPLISLSAAELAAFLVSAFFLVLGIGLFNLGADMAMTPMGEHVGAGLTSSKKKSVLLIVCFLMGLLVTVAEPDLSVLAAQVSNVVSGTVLVVTVGVGVGLFLVISVLKIAFGKSLPSILLFFYMMLFALASLVIASGNSDFIALAFDSGGVTTGPITVPFIMALGVGIATTIGGKNVGENSFGLVALCSIGPILSVLLLGIGAGSEIKYDIPEYSMEAHLGGNFLPTVLETLGDVALALGLIVAFFAALQLIFLKLPRTKLLRIGMGILYTLAGLVIFLTAVEVGFMPIGYKLGAQLAGSSELWLSVFGLILGMVVVLAEPAVHVLNRQVEDITDGMVSRRSMLIALSAGVGISICLSMIRIIFDFSILYYLIPGYLVSLGLSFFVPGIYTAIAFDSGGVASGPLTSSFILPFAIGACCAVCGGDTGKVLYDAFGVVAMVAMTPLITIQLLGFGSIMRSRVHSRIAMKHILSADDEQIIEFS